MKYNIDFSSEFNAAVITGSGEVTREGIQAFHKDYLSHELWEPGMNVIIDFRRLSFKKFKPNDIQFIKDLVVGSKEEIGGGKMAILISTDNEFGLARMWEMKTDSFVAFRIHVFKEKEEALEWIGREDEHWEG